MFASSKLYSKSLAIMMYVFSLTLCIVVVAEPLVNNLEISELCSMPDTIEEKADNTGEDRDTEPGAELQDLYLNPHYHLFQISLSITDNFFSCHNTDFPTDYRDILSPPPKG